MTNRYLLLVNACADARARSIAELARNGLSRIVLDTPGILLLTDRDAAIIDLDGDGAIIGTLFEEGCSGCVRALRDEDRGHVAASGGQHLVDHFWGGYVAVLTRADETVVLRSPFGWLPCFHVTTDRTTAFGSDLDVIKKTGMWSPSLDPAGVARQLAASDVRRADTCLTDLSELRGGERWSRSGKVAAIWSPWTHIAENVRIDDPIDAELALRAVAVRCVGDLTPDDATTLLMMSGGLDSSIVAACLKANERNFAALTFLTDNPSSDERRYARAVADRIGTRLIEALCSSDVVELTRSDAAHLARPVARSFEQAINFVLRNAAEDIGAQTVVCGGGGDNIFCSLQSPAMAADCLIDPAGRSFFWRVARDTAELTGASLVTVIRRAWLRSLTRRPYRRDPDLSFLSPTGAALAAGALDHPWLRAPRGTLPGRTAHVGLLVGAQGVIEDCDPSAHLAMRSIMIAQPLVEACLRIPSWQWLALGRNRGAARRAFEHDLPADVIWRRTKGSPDSLLVRLFERNKPLIRSLLTDGILAQLNMLDEAMIHAAIDDPSPQKGHSFARMMQLVDAEVWARGWA